MKIAICQLNFNIGDLDYNCNKIIKEITAAKEKASDLVLFSELSICGYPPRDLLEYDCFIQEIDKRIQEIIEVSTGIDVLLGAPTENKIRNGKGLFNSVLHISNGKVKKRINKTLLPNYDIFDEARYFESNNSFDLIEVKGKQLAIAICEDIWNANNNLYNIDPVEALLSKNPDSLVCISASPFDYNQLEERQGLLQSIAKKGKLPIIYVNQVGAYTDVVFDGGSMVVDSNGNKNKVLSLFKEETHYFDTTQHEVMDYKHPSKIALIHDALIIGIRDYFNKLGFKKAVIGLSGGIDSAVVTALAVEALGKEHVDVLLLPSKYSSDHSITDSEEIVTNLGIASSIVSIKNIYDSFENTLSPVFEDKEADVTEENLQARIRGTILMAYSNKFGNILLNTSNKSEMAVGYSTIYGDMNGGLSVMGDLFKTEVFDLARYINREQEIIPQNIITKPPSAELRPDQKDSDSLPDYEVLDSILYQYIDLKKGQVEINELGYDKNLVNKIINLVNMNEYKRYQSPPIIKISTKSFGSGRRMPIVAKYLI